MKKSLEVKNVFSIKNSELGDYVNIDGDSDYDTNSFKIKKEVEVEKTLFKAKS